MTGPVKTYQVIVGPNGEVFQPASCWIVDVDMHSEKELRADIGFAGHLGDVLARYGARDLLAEVERLSNELPVVKEFVAARAEYITAINNCHPDNHADYWRWQGHASARRQLSERLGLPVAWPSGYEQQDVAPAGEPAEQHGQAATS